MYRVGKVLYKTVGKQFGKGVNVGALLNYLRWASTYQSRVDLETGVIGGYDTTKAIYKVWQQTGLYDNLWMQIAAEGGLIVRDSGSEKFVSKAFDFSPSDRDNTQTTEVEQPFVGGRIAPNELQCFRSVTGESMNLNHPTLSVSSTYTLIKVLKEETVGKTQVSFEEMNSGTYDNVSWTGDLYLYGFVEGSLSVDKMASVRSKMLSIFNEIESVTIGSQTWATSNFEAIATPMGNVIQEMQSSSAVEKITNSDDRDFSSDTGFWTLGTGWSIGSGVLSGSVASYAEIRSTKITTAGRWYKLTFTILNYGSGGVRIGLGGVGGSTTKSGNGTYTHYIKATGSNYTYLIGYGSGGTFEGDIDNVSVQELGWADSQELYDGLIAQGETEQTALEAAAMWSYYNNDPSIGAWAGKLYNWFAVKLLQMDIDYYNAANPSTPWGYRVPTQTDFDTLATTLGGASVAGGKMKVVGTDYWNSPNTGADNSSRFSAIGVGYRMTSGTFQQRSEVIRFQVVDSYLNKFILYTSSELGASSINDSRYGSSLRLIKS